MGIQIGLEFLSELDYVQNRSIHILTDCQPAIKTAFGNQLPKNKIDIVFDIKNSLGKIQERNNKIIIIVHWVPGHKEIEGNELADKQAKEAASDMGKPDIPVEPIFNKKEAVTEIKSKWSPNGTKNMPVLKRLAAYRIYFMKLEREIAMEKGTDQHLQL